MPRHPRRDDGFTLIEMIVAIVLLSVAFAAILPAIFNTRDSTTRQAAVSQADGDVKLAAKLFERDVRSAHGTRSTGDRNGVGSGGTASTSASLMQPVSGTVHDVVVAEPHRLVIYTDAIAEPAGSLPVPERVTWQRITNNNQCGSRSRSNQNWCIVRTVQGASTTSEVVVAARGSAPRTSSCFPGGVSAAVQDRTFCYELAAPSNNSYTYTTWSSQCNSTWNTGLAAIGTGIAPTRPNAVETFGLANVDKIVTVGAAFQAGGAYGRSAERSYEGTQVSIRSRESPAYREAIMCGSRAGWFR